MTLHGNIIGGLIVLFMSASPCAIDRAPIPSIAELISLTDTAHPKWLALPYSHNIEDQRE